MSQEKDIESRRRFLKVAAGTAAAAAVVGGMPRFARAADLPHVAESDPTAKAYGPCQLFPGKSVNAKGWCVSHTARKA